MQQQLGRERNKLLRSFENILEGPMIFLGFVWLVLLVIELIWGLPNWLQYFSLGIWILFIFEFILKFILAPSKRLFFKRSWLTAISLVIPALRIFRIFRIVRVVRGLRGIRLIRVVSSLNRSMKSLGATMERRGVKYVVVLTIIVIFAGGAGMYAIEKPNPGFENYGASLWWTAMRVVTAGSESWPLTAEGRGLAFLIAVFGYAVFGYVTATIASFFIGRDAEEKDAPVAGVKDVMEVQKQLIALTQMVSELKTSIEKKE
ncbi:MAG TPA: ion transporter [Flavisolibacter sp.]|nr:ion transporter [Flavisolibacter sp.]